MLLGLTDNAINPIRGNKKKAQLVVSILMFPISQSSFSIARSLCGSHMNFGLNNSR